MYIRSSCITYYNSPGFFAVLSERPGERGGRAEDFILRQKRFNASEYFNPGRQGIFNSDYRITVFAFDRRRTNDVT